MTVDALATTSDRIAKTAGDINQLLLSVMLNIETRTLPRLDVAKPSGCAATDRKGITEATPPNCRTATTISARHDNEQFPPAKRQDNPKNPREKPRALVVTEAIRKKRCTGSARGQTVVSADFSPDCRLHIRPHWLTFLPIGLHIS